MQQKDWFSKELFQEQRVKLRLVLLRLHSVPQIKD